MPGETLIKRFTQKLLISIFFLGFVIFPLQIIASDLVDVQTITDRILVLHFDDGIVKYNELSGTEEVLVNDLDTEMAVKPAMYYLTSRQDQRFAKPVLPLAAGRKSKAMEISNNCNWVTSPYDPSKNICDNDYASEHWIYLELPYSLQQGKEYTLWIGDLADNLDKINFVFDVFTMQSPTIHVNNLGYDPDAPAKYAYAGHWMGDMGPLDLTDYKDKKAYLYNLNTHDTIKISPLALRRSINDSQKDFNGDRWGPYNNLFAGDVYETDFSTVTQTGEYILVVEGIGHSYPFEIKQDVYREAFYYTIRSLYHQRAGIELKEPYTKWTRDRDHHPDDGFEIKYTTVKSNQMGENKDLYDEVVNNATESLNTWGWYHDAGDWDEYLHHANVPIRLFALYELKPANFADGELNIPQFQNGVELDPGTGNGIPDILDEAAWLVEHYRRNIRPSGGVCGGRTYSDMNDKPSIPRSDLDDRIWYAGAEDPHTSFAFAGLAATYAYCLEMAGVKDSTEKLITEAQAAYNWAKNNISAEDEGIEVDGGDVYDWQMYAATCLYKFTTQSSYFADIESVNKVTSPTSSFDGQKWGAWLFTTIPNDSLKTTDAQELKNTISQAVIKDAEEMFLESAKQRSARVGYNMFMPPIIGSTTTPEMTGAMFAYPLLGETKKQEFLTYMHTTCDYFLGGNPLNITWISGLGDYHPTDMLHLDSRYDGRGKMYPGFVPYGPTMAGSSTPMGPWDAGFPKVRSYPKPELWPTSQMFYNSRLSVMDGEFTIHQNLAPAAFAYGFLTDELSTAYTDNQVPEVTISIANSGESFDEKDTLAININATDDEKVSKLVIFDDYHPVVKINSNENLVKIPATQLKSGTRKINVQAIDNKGIKGRSDTISVQIENNHSPEIIHPTHGSLYFQSDTVHFKASIPEGTQQNIEKIVILQNGQVLDSIDATAEIVFIIDSLGGRDNLMEIKLLWKEGFVSDANVNVYAEPALRDIQLDYSAVKIRVDEFFQINKTLIPVDAYNAKVVWSILDENVATIDTAGVIKGLTEGETSIICQSVSRPLADTVKVTVLPPLPEGAFQHHVIPGKIEAENYDYGGEGKAYHDNSPGNSYDTYRKDGVDIENVWDNGQAYILNDVQAGEWLEYTVYVAETNQYEFYIRQVTGIDDAGFKLYLDDVQVSPNYLFPKGNWWPLSNITYEDIWLTKGEHKLKFHFTKGPVLVNYFGFECSDCSTTLPLSVEITETANLAPGETTTLSAATDPADVSLWWRSINEDVAVVDQQGNVTGIAEGSTQIVAKTHEGALTDTCDVYVVGTTIEFVPVSDFSFDSDTIKINTGHIIQPQITFTPENATDKKLFWVSSNPSIAKVTTYSTIKALNKGMAKLYATSRDNTIQKTLVVKVTNNSPTVSITQPGNESEFEMGDKISISVEANDSDGIISKLEIMANDNIITTFYSTPYQFDWTPAEGTYYLKAKAYDFYNDKGISQIVKIAVKNTSGIQKGKKSQFKVFPNPFTDNVVVELPTVNNSSVLVAIQDISGRTVYLKSFSDASGNITLNNLGSLSKGLYIFKITLFKSSGQQNYIQHILKTI